MRTTLTPTTDRITSHLAYAQGQHCHETRSHISHRNPHDSVGAFPDGDDREPESGIPTAIRGGVSMRVLLIPEVYRRDDLSSNGTVSDTRMWVEQWLETDDRLHVYWLLPPRGAVNYDAEDVFADRERVTLIEAEPFDAGGDPSIFTEGGYSAAQLTALKRTIFDSLGYVDAVVDQLRTGRTTLYKWLLQHTDQWAARVRPFDVIADIHDLQVPFKYRYCSYRNEFQM